jgi:hypothetical protein
MIIGLLLLIVCAQAVPLLDSASNQNETNLYNFTLDWENYQERIKTDMNLKYMDSLAQNCSQNIFVIVGGTNAANNGQLFTYNVTGQVLIWNSTSGWSFANFPLYGADGYGGSSPWLIFADKLSNQIGSPVCLIDIARTASHIKDWSAPTGKYTQLLNNALLLMIKYGNGNVMFQQGEADSNYIYYDSNYANYLYDIIYTSGQSINWYVSQTSYSPTNQKKYENYVRSAQSLIVENSPITMKVFAGPNTDALCTLYRVEDFYFNKMGIITLSEAWLQAYNQQNKSFVLGNGHCTTRYITYLELYGGFIFIFGTIALFILSLSVFGYGMHKYGYDRRIVTIYRRTFTNGYSKINGDNYVEQQAHSTSPNSSKPPPYTQLQTSK